jgi:hypothetical protein
MKKGAKEVFRAWMRWIQHREIRGERENEKRADKCINRERKCIDRYIERERKR